MKTKLTKSIVFLCALALTTCIGISLYSESDPGPIGQVPVSTQIHNL
ncbi:hypothetical protein GCM10008908_28270 [Clostridium subterminale]|uniref:Lipoprotein n=1 Tax=Clostridium subterminale TaxID=1550 RepID=A0ABN1KTX4_CLOSU